MRKRIILLLTVMLFLYGMVMTVYAHDVPDLTQKGSIEITLQKDDAVVAGGNLTLYRVGEIQEEDGNYSFALVEEFADSGEFLEDIQSPELAQNLADYAAGMEGITKEIDQNGKVVFSELELGLYMLVQGEAAPGYNKVSPFLVSVPEWVNGVYIYQVEAGPKVELTPLVTPPPTPKPTTSPSTPPPTNPPDEPSTRLPQTGQLNWPIPLMAVLGLWIFAMGWVLRFGQKKDRDEK